MPGQIGLKPILEQLLLIPLQLHVVIQVPGNQPVQLIVNKTHSATCQHQAGQHNQAQAEYMGPHTVLFPWSLIYKRYCY